jgi:electron transfer flavoprotein alpha subunit
LKEKQNFSLIFELAEAIGGSVGASRPVVDAEWLPREYQIGSSGQTVSPRLYFAIGISGAIQHLVGMQTSRCIVAINKDSEAPIFKVAHYGIVDDLFKVVPALTKIFKDLKQP